MLKYYTPVIMELEWSEHSYRYHYDGPVFFYNDPFARIAFFTLFNPSTWILPGICWSLISRLYLFCSHFSSKPYLPTIY